MRFPPFFRRQRVSRPTTKTMHLGLKRVDEKARRTWKTVCRTKSTEISMGCPRRVSQRLQIELNHNPALAARTQSHYIAIERLVRTGESPTRSGPKGSSRNEYLLGRCQPLATSRNRLSVAYVYWPVAHRQTVPGNHTCAAPPFVGVTHMHRSEFRIPSPLHSTLFPSVRHAPDLWSTPGAAAGRIIQGRSVRRLAGANMESATESWPSPFFGCRTTPTRIGDITANARQARSVDPKTGQGFPANRRRKG